MMCMDGADVFVNIIIIRIAPIIYCLEHSNNNFCRFLKKFYFHENLEINDNKNFWGKVCKSFYEIYTAKDILKSCYYPGTMKYEI